MKQYHIYHFTTNDETQKEILIAQLMDAGFDGVEETPGSFTASVETTRFDAEQVAAILERTPITYTVTTETEQNWNSRWEADFEPVQVGSFATVRASFHPQPGAVKHDIIITPKMSFGTGHHATTYMMMEQMQPLPFAGQRIFDFGTGTGVLAILARKMGAWPVIAIDNDEWSISNARENIAVNHCDGINLCQGEQPAPGPFDGVLANINLNVLDTHMPALAGAMAPGAWILLSGFLHDDENTMRNILKINGLQVSSVAERNNWLCIRALKPAR